jgi:hypothetical protein
MLVSRETSVRLRSLDRAGSGTYGISSVDRSSGEGLVAAARGAGDAWKESRREAAGNSLEGCAIAAATDVVGWPEGPRENGCGCGGRTTCMDDSRTCSMGSGSRTVGARDGSARLAVGIVRLTGGRAS